MDKKKIFKQILQNEIPEFDVNSLQRDAGLELIKDLEEIGLIEQVPTKCKVPLYEIKYKFNVTMRYLDLSEEMIPYKIKEYMSWDERVHELRVWFNPDQFISFERDMTTYVDQAIKGLDKLLKSK